jgi:hypothetical protein
MSSNFREIIRKEEEEYDRTRGLSHGCRQSWDLRLRGEKGPGLKINGLFHWASGDSLILHEVAKTAGLEGHGARRKVSTLYMGSGVHLCVLGPTHGLERRGGLS